MAMQRRRKLSERGRGTSPVPHNKQTVSVPMRTSAPLIEQFYVAVDRQLKSGYGTYDSAEKVAQEIKKRHPTLQVTLFDAKEQRYTAIGQQTSSTKRRA